MKNDGCKKRAYALTHVNYSVAFLLTRHPDPPTSYATLITCDGPPAEFIPPVQEPYQYIVFRASDVKDLAVDADGSVHDDPAVLGVRVLFSIITILLVLGSAMCDEALRM